MAETAIALCGLGRCFRPDGPPALAEVSADVLAGEVLGVVGANGAGKTTLLNVLATLITPSSGSAAVFDHDVLTQPDTVRRLVGFAPRSDRGHYGRLDLRENLRVFGSLQGLSGAQLARRIETLLDTLSARDQAREPLQAASTGVRQRFNLMRALLHEPRVLLLDEPFQGLDAQGSEGLLRALSEWRGRADRVVVTAAPCVEDLRLVCDRVLRLDHGRLVPA